jgi:hypothetical protein
MIKPLRYLLLVSAAVLAVAGVAVLGVAFSSSLERHLDKPVRWATSVQPVPLSVPEPYISEGTAPIVQVANERPVDVQTTKASTSMPEVVRQAPAP